MNYQVIKSFNIPPLIKSIILWLIISLITYFLSKDKLKFKYCITMFISSIGVYFIHNYTGLLSIQKEMILSLFIIITFLWINSKKSKIFLVFCFIMLFFPNYSDILDDLQLNYSSSKETTQFIKENISTDEDIVVINDYHITSLAGYAPEYNFINIFQNNNKNKFISWSKERKLKVNEFSFSHDQCSYINNLINQNEYYLVIEQNYFNLFYCEDFHLIYKSPPCIRGNENYFIYYVTVNK